MRPASARASVPAPSAHAPRPVTPVTPAGAEQAGHLHLLGLTVAMLRYRVAIMVWTFMLLGAAAGDGARLDAYRLALAACSLGWSYVAATTVNDLADVQIDLVNHPNDPGRPLVTGAAAPADMRSLHWAAWVAALGAATALGLLPALMVLGGLAIGRAYSSAWLRLSYRPHLAPLSLVVAYVAVPYGLGLWSSGRDPGARALVLGAALAALFLARIILKDFRDREGDALFGRRSILLVHGKGFTCRLSGLLIALGDALLCAALGAPAWPLLLVAQGFLAMVGLMLWRLWTAGAPRAEQVAIGTGAKMANGLLLGLLSWLVTAGHGAPVGLGGAFLVFMLALYGGSFFTLARHPEDAVIGYKG